MNQLSTMSPTMTTESESYYSAPSPNPSVDSSGDGDGKKKRRPKFIRIVDCHVCGDKANDHIHYGAISCYSCRAFFRRGVGASDQYQCTYGQKCKITLKSRKQCQYCRFQKCLEIGMKPTWVMTDEEKKEKREKTIKRKQLPPAMPKIKLQAMLQGEDQTQYEQRMREERIQSRLARKRRPTPGEVLSGNSVTSPGSSGGYASPLNLAENSSQYDGSENSPVQFHGKFETLTVSIASASSPGSSTLAGSPTPGSMGQMAEYQPTKDVPPLTPLSINDPVFEDIIDSPPAPMMIASAAAVLYDYLEPDQGVKNEPGESEDGICHMSYTRELSKIAVINQQRYPTQILTTLHKSPNWVITIEEKNFIQELCQLELNTSKSLPVPTSIMYMIINAAKTGTAIPVEVAVQGYSICMQRVIKYASSMEFFNRLPEPDRFKLLLKNVDMVVNIRTARLLRPDINLRDQLSHVLGLQNQARRPSIADNSGTSGPGGTSLEGPDLGPNALVPRGHSPSNQNTSKDINRLEVFQIFPTPWASDKQEEEQYEKLLREIFELRMDHVTTTLLTLMALFTDTETDDLTMPKEVNALQEHFTRLLSRYLSEQVGQTNANNLIPQYKSAIKSLREMAHIFTQKRLKL